METVIVAVILFVILAGAAVYVYRAKKKGKKCIGCPGGACCSCKMQENM